MLCLNCRYLLCIRTNKEFVSSVGMVPAFDIPKTLPICMNANIGILSEMWISGCACTIYSDCFTKTAQFLRVILFYQSFTLNSNRCFVKLESSSIYRRYICIWRIYVGPCMNPWISEVEIKCYRWMYCWYCSIFERRFNKFQIYLFNCRSFCMQVAKYHQPTIYETVCHFLAQNLSRD